MYRGYLRYFIGFFVTIGLIIILIVLLFGGSDKNKAKIPDNPQTLTSLAGTTAEVKLTIDGPVNADQSHEQIRILVNNSSSNFELVQGYEGTITKSQSYESNESAFTNFLHALSVAGFTKGDKSESLKDERGYCPLGKRYIFEVIQDEKTVSRFWSTSCGKPKTYLGSTSLTLNLFKQQIPDYNDLLDDASIR